MKQTTANILQIESTTTDENFPGDVTGPSIIATASGSADKGETAQVFGQPGLISNPSKGNIGLRISKGSLDIVVGTMNYSIPLPENPGETLLFSTNEDGSIQSKLFLDTEGNFIFNDGEDFAVRYSELETAYNQLRDDFDALVGDYNSHTHDGVIVAVVPGTGGASGTSGSSGTTSAEGSESTGDITPSKIEEINVP